MSKGLIIEGVVGAGKTTLYSRLLEHPAFCSRPATLALPETYTQRVIEQAPAPALAESLSLLDSNVEVVAGLVRRYRESRFHQGGEDQLGLAYLFERFHLSHAVLFSQGEFQPYRHVDEMLRFLGARLVLCTVSEAELPHRVAGTRAHRDQQWCEYLDLKIAHKTAVMEREEVDRTVGEHFLKQQRAMQSMATESVLPLLQIDTTDRRWDLYVEQIVRFWGLM